jgi:hypothetical protein
MAWAAIFKAGVKVTATFIEIADTVADAATLGDEIAKAAMGENYDPAFRDKCREVAAKGKLVDALVPYVKNLQTDIENLNDAMDALNLSIETYDYKQAQVKELMDKVNQFNLIFVDQPTAYAWLTGPAQRTNSHINAEKAAKEIPKVEAYLGQIKFSPTTIAITSAELLFAAVCRGLRRYFNRSSQIEPPVVRQRRNAFSGMEMLPEADVKAIKAIRRKRKIAIGLDVVSKAGSAISLGFTIMGIFNRVKSRNEAFAALEKQLEDYKNQAAAYVYCVVGYNNLPSPTSTQLASNTEFRPVPFDPAIDRVAQELRSLQSQKVANLDKIDPNKENLQRLEENLKAAEAKLSSQLNQNESFKAAKYFFQADDPTSKDEPKKKVPWDVRDDLGLGFGMNSILNQTNDRCDKMLKDIESLFDDMIEALEGTLNSTDEYDKFARSYISNTAVIKEVRKDKDKFIELAAIAKDKSQSSQDRKDKGFDPIQNLFKNSLQTLMSKVVDSAVDQLRNLQFAAQVAVEAQQILEDADKEEKKAQLRVEESRRKDEGIRALARQFLVASGKSATEEDVDRKLQEMGLASNSERFDRDAFILDKINASAKNEWEASDLDTEPTTRFPDQESVRALLTLMIKDLSEKKPPISV